MAAPDPAAALDAGLHALGLSLGASARQGLMDFLALLVKWNRVYNLTAVRDPGEMVTRHLLDSLAVLPQVQGPRLLDVGSGAGLPGIPLALACPDWSFTLLDSNGKKTRFITQAVAELGLGNVSVVQARVAEYTAGTPFDTVISRAFASLADMLDQTGHLCAPNGQVLAMKGVYPGEELAALPAGWRVAGVSALQVPGLAGERHVVRLVRASAGLDRTNTL